MPRVSMNHSFLKIIESSLDAARARLRLLAKHEALK
jgi:hypothetical protein